MSEARRVSTSSVEVLPELSFLDTLRHEVQINAMEAKRSEPAQAVIELVGAVELLVYQAAVVPLSLLSVIKGRPRGEYHA